MNEAGASLKGVSESVRISSAVKKKLQEYSRQRKQPLRRIIDKAIYTYVQDRLEKESC
jgi:predicted transcriptional regulator